MFFFISKILHALINPIVWVFIILTINFFNKRNKKKLIIIAFTLLYVFSNSFLLDEAFRFYEERSINPLKETQQYDVAIILGGGTSYDNDLQLEQFHSSIDRLLHGVQLYHTGKAKKIMVVGGSGSISRPEEREGLILYNFLIKSGIPKQDIIVESSSKNTHENAVNTAEILNKEFKYGKFLLITSGYHMPRAKRCFQKAGIIVTPFSVDQYAGKRKYFLDHLFIPNAQALANWNIILHEWLGYISYKIVGYI